MPTVVLSPIGGAGEQFFNNNGTVLSGGKIYTYAAGTTTPLTTYTSLAGTVANPNPVVLNSAGRVSGQIWLIYGASYKFVIKDSLGNTIDTQDNISGLSAAGGLVTAATIVALKAMTGMTTGTRVLVQDLGLYRYDDGAASTANESSIVTPASALGRWIREIWGVGGLSAFNVLDYGAVGDGVADDTTEIAAAEAAAYAAGGTLYLPPGKNFLITSTVTLRCHVQATGATITTSADIVAVQVGDGTNYARDLLMFLPNVTNAAKVSTGWTGTTYVGVKVVSALSCEIHFGHITGFLVGAWITSTSSKGNVYNTYHVGHLDNNKVNMKLLPGGVGGWCNENIFIGGRFSNNIGEGTAVSGTRHILIDFVNDASGFACNNNVWHKPSVEGDVPEFHLEINSGGYNYINHGRWEATTPKVKLSGYSGSKICSHNVIFYGYNAQGIVFTEGSNTQYNSLYSTSKTKLFGPGGTSGVLVMQNGSSSANPVLVGMESSATLATDPATDYGFHLGSQSLKGKRAADAGNRIRLDFVNGRIYFGNGTSESTGYLVYGGSNAVGVEVGNFTFISHAYNAARPVFGTTQAWFDAAGGIFRTKTSNPSTATDGQPLNTYTATATLDFGSIAAGATAELTVSVANAAVGMAVSLGPPAAIEAGLMWSGYVSASGVGTIRLHNTTGGSIDPASADWRFTAHRA